MKLSAFSLTYEAQHRVLIVLFGVLVVMTVALATMGISLVRREQIVVVAPPVLDREMAIGRSSADIDYKRAWAVFVAETLGDITPANLAFMRETVERLVDASIYREVTDRLEAELDKVRRDQLSISFLPHRVLVEEDRDRVFVHGISTVRTPLGGEVRTARTFEMTIAVSNYAPRLTFLTTYAGDPRTADVLARMQEPAQ
ncbi:TraE/TraK family type IV conjugative transfer system protein [Rubrimonas cliftonensis]|uniref:Conjugal transfer pilus assembly protein TraE n=1 Tax=Rubrimonas cliftonensis TaxID=89524 RepID=A0A1H4EPY1_9RHOB|nr:TraE/TraK family type IV conjugative transfer system protein [Rubrimonas cliftonensis]SEA87071.1 conjugal transfer pilus assembly protein TraE [Rubrimonas cliftonensis]